MREQWHQTKVQKYLEKQWYITLNLIKTNKNWIADLLILVWDSKHFWIEMKDLKWKESKLQEYMRRKLTKHWDISIVCHWFDDFLQQFPKVISALNKQN